MNTELTQRQKRHEHGMIERLAPEKLSAAGEPSPIPAASSRYTELGSPQA